MKNVKALSFSFFVLVGYLTGLMHRGFSTQYDDGFSASLGLIIGGVAVVILGVTPYLVDKMKKKSKESEPSVGQVNKLDLHKEFKF